jgi:inner membrane protein involved in colicin E2 resistance
MAQLEAMYSIKRIIAIILVLVAASIGWLVLGAVTAGRTSGAGERTVGEVSSLWGEAQQQRAPSFTFVWTSVHKVEQIERENGRSRVLVSQKEETHRDPVTLDKTDIDARLRLDQRLRGLMWYSLYDVVFDGTWTYQHQTPQSGDVEVTFAFPVPHALYDDFRFVVNGRDLARGLKPESGRITTSVPVTAGQTVVLNVHYKARGMDNWTYDPSDGVASLHDFRLRVACDFADIDYPNGSLSPSDRKRQPDGGWLLTWQFGQVLTGQSMGLVMPDRVQPGQLSTSLISTAPLSLLFFFLIVFSLSVLRGLDIHPINYLAIAGAFFSFQLLFAYSVDHLTIVPAFILASAASIIMVVSYMRLVVSARFAFVEAALAQLVYQVGFSLAHFWKGYTGLTIAVLATVTLFVLMLLTARVRWSVVLGKKP